MIRFLIPRLTPRPRAGASLFDALVAEARQPHWYLAGEIPDSIDGRFAVLATLTALTSVRLDRGGEQARTASVNLTERFVDAMDAEHRQIGLGDPGLGKTVRKLVTALGRRVDQWREAIASSDGWTDTVRDSLYRERQPQTEALDHSAHCLRLFWTRLVAASDEDLVEGRLQ